MLCLTTYDGHLRTSTCAGSRAIGDTGYVNSAQIRVAVEGGPVPTETLGARLAAGSSAPNHNPTWLFAGFTAAAVLGLAGVAAVAWRGARRG